jgi:quercetin dioxygenase-like cupin family protein
MHQEQIRVRIFHIPSGDALETRDTPYGSVGELFSGDGIEMVWVCKQNEEIDPDWFSQPTVDLILVVKGQLRFEFEDDKEADRTLKPGDLLVLPANTRCRAYHWPRESDEAAIFLACYPLEPAVASSDLSI